jgi:diguanylate cyclase (GGDEF)-like protein
MLALAVLALAAHAAMLHLQYLRNPGLDVRAALTEFVVLAIVLPWFAVMGGYVNRLRTQLSDSHRSLQRAFERIEELAVHDELTGAYNRRFLMEQLARERSRGERLSAPFSVCLIDIDHFKAVNDGFGHAAGDAVLKHFATLVPQELRSIDVYGRFGGEEFLVILPDTAREGALACAERVRARTAATAFPGVPAGRQVTVTVGVATHAPGEETGALLARADAGLYKGKAQGRNQVVAA